jgi:two-component system, LytTR family, response regulator
MKIDCIIVEDEPLAMERTMHFVQKIPFLNLLNTFDNAFDALAFLKSHTVDLMFLDINLGEFSGIQLLETATISSQVILATAYPDYALKGYELKVTDYLLKPYTFDRFMQAVNRVQELMEKKAPPLRQESSGQYLEPKKHIFVKTEHRLEKINLEDVLYIEGMGDYRRIFTTQKRLMTLQTFTDFEKEIPTHILCRVHKSYMVAIDKIDTIERDRIKIGTVSIPISETYRQGFFELIQK